MYCRLNLTWPRSAKPWPRYLIKIIQISIIEMKCIWWQILNRVNFRLANRRCNWLSRSGHRSWRRFDPDRWEVLAGYLLDMPLRANLTKSNHRTFHKFIILRLFEGATWTKWGVIWWRCGDRLTCLNWANVEAVKSRLMICSCNNNDKCMLCYEAAVTNCRMDWNDSRAAKGAGFGFFPPRRKSSPC